MTGENDKKALQEILEKLNEDRFTDKELEVLHKMIDLWNAFEIFGRVANVGRNIFIYCAAFIFLWFTPFDQIVKIVKKYLGFE